MQLLISEIYSNIATAQIIASTERVSSNVSTTLAGSVTPTIKTVSQSVAIELHVCILCKFI